MSKRTGCQSFRPAYHNTTCTPPLELCLQSLNPLQNAQGNRKDTDLWRTYWAKTNKPKKKKGSTIEDWTEIWFLRMRNGLLIPILSYFPSSFSFFFFLFQCSLVFFRLFSMCLVLGAILKIQRKYAAKFLHNVFRAPSLSLRPKHFPISTHCCGFPCEASYFFLRQQLLLA